MLFNSLGQMETWTGMSSAGNLGEATLMLVGTVAGGMTTGSIIQYRGGSLWYIGTGTLMYNNATYSGVPATLTLRPGGIGGTPVTAGLPAPSAPTIAATGSGKNEGSYSIKITYVRRTTGAEGNASPASNVLVPVRQQIRLTTPATSNGADAIGIYGSRRGFGATGPWYFVKETTTFSGTHDFEYYDGDLGDTLAPIDYDDAEAVSPATEGFCFALGNVMCYTGGFGPGSISPSIPGKPEAFPPDFTVFLNPNETIVGVKGRATDGWQYILCRNSTHAAILTPSRIAPILPRAIWTEVGFPSAKAACIVHGALYGYTLQRGVVRTTSFSEPDSSFAIPVERDINSWTASTVGCGYSPADDAVVFYGTASGTNYALAYFRKFNKWSTPLELPAGTLGGSVTIAGQLYITIGSNLRIFNAGTGPGNWSARTAFRDAGAPWLEKTIYRTEHATSGSMNIVLMKNMDTGSSTALAAPSSSDVHTVGTKLNVRDCRSYAVKFSGSAAAKVYESVVWGNISEDHA